ncbi:MAG: heavy metal translocating P-type ATPase [Candidatus Magnetomorum sp.]|nr:heavy metal translocating P-type ATPase [Candidatus Magnetomorum sp.]
MFIEVCLLSFGTVAGVDLYQKIKKKIKAKYDQISLPQNPPDPQKDPETNVVKEIKTDAQYNQELAFSSGLMGFNISGYLLRTPVLNLITIPGLVYLIMPLLKDAYSECIENKKVGQNTLYATIQLSLLFMRYITFLSFFSTLLSLSNKLIAKTKDSSKSKLVTILGTPPKHVWIQKDTIEIRIPVDQLNVGEQIIVQTGEVIPIDGIVIKGLGRVDQHMLTGESMPIDVNEGKKVFASTIVLSGKIWIQVEKTGQDTCVAHIEKILNQTADYKSTLETYGEFIANESALPTLLLSAITLPVLGPVSATAILSSSFGYTMRIAAPLSILNFLQIASDKGILIKDGRALEELITVDTVFFDKTGTLTIQELTVWDIHTCNGYTDDHVLIVAASAEYKQSHPIALALTEAAERKGLQRLSFDESTYSLGHGLKVKIQNQDILVGSDQLLISEQISIPQEMQEVQNRCYHDGHSMVYVSIEGKVAGGIEIHASIRPETQKVIQELKNRGLDIYIVSGDHEHPTRYMANQLGLSDQSYFFGVLPQDKAELIHSFQEKGKKVCFIGDGINDGIALKRANVSCSLSGATSIATDTAQIIFMNKDLTQLVELFDLSKKFQKNMDTNLLTTLYPGVLTIGGVFLFHFGVITTELIFYLSLMSGVINAQLPLLKKDKEKNS